MGEVIPTIAIANQISWELTVSDHGIDMEIDARMAEAQERQREEAGEADRLRGRAVRRDERAAGAGAEAVFEAELSGRQNIVVIADEAHRSQYGFGGKVNEKTGEMSYGFASNLRGALPNASGK